MAQTPTTLFPSIGSVADQTDNLQTRETDESSGNPTFSTNDNEEKVVQEVESLCMKCGEQVSLIFFFLFLLIISDFFSRELRVFSLHPSHFFEK